MKSLFLLAAIASTAFVSYSYSSSDGKSCLVCPMTGEPVFTSAAAESGSCCAGGMSSLLTGPSPVVPSWCCEASGSDCSNGDEEATLTSAACAECQFSGEKRCCKDEVDAVDVIESEELIAPEDQEVLAELTEGE